MSAWWILPLQRISRLLVVSLCVIFVGCNSSGGENDGEDDANEGNDQQILAIVDYPHSLFFSAVGDEQPVVVEATDQNGSLIDDLAITWSSSNDNIATVNDDGFVISRSNGSATISFTINGGTCCFSIPVTVQQVVTTVQLNPSSIEFNGPTLGINQPISAVAFDANNNPVTGQIFSWHSSEASVASVDASGIVTSRGNGLATVTAAAGGVVAAVAVSVQLSLTVQLTPASLNFTAIGESQQLVADAFDSNGIPINNASFIWSSTDESITTVSEDGLVTSQGNGNAKITASIENSASVNASATVNQAVASINIFPEVIGLVSIGARTQATAEARDANGNEILSINSSQQNFQWASSDETTATVVDGQITAQNYGDAIISATLGTFTDSVPATIEFPGNFSLLPTDWTMPISKTVRFLHKLGGSHLSEVEWAVDGIQGGNSTVGTIDSDGTYTAPAIIPTTNPVMVRASLVSDPTVNAETPITITSGDDADQYHWHQMIPAVATPGSNEPLMLESKFGGYPRFAFEHGDGTRKEPVALRTGIYAWQFSTEELLSGFIPEGSLFKQAGFIRYFLCDEQCSLELAESVRIGILDARIPPVGLVSIANDVQASSHLVNMVTDWSPGMLIPPSPTTRDTQKLYQYFPDDFDFLTYVQHVNSTENASFSTVANNALGIGRAVYNESATFGSQGRLQGIVRFPGDGWINADRIFLHELGHRWSAYLTQPPISANRSHWYAFSTLSKDIMNLTIFEFEHVSQNVYEILCPPIDHSQPQLEYSDLELYLMGLIPPDQVPPQVMFQDRTLSYSCNSQGIADVVTIDDIIAEYGARDPDHTQSQKDFTMATVVVSLNRLLTADEMAYYNYITTLWESRTPVPTNGTFSSLSNTFHTATGGRATLSTRVLP